MPEPDPRGALTPAEFVSLLHALKEWSGLTYRELTARAEAEGDVLPRSTVANMLSRATVPREELVAAYARACGCPPASVAEWLSVRKELAVRGRRAPEAGLPAEAGPPAESSPRADSPAASSPPTEAEAPEGARNVTESEVPAPSPVAGSGPVALPDPPPTALPHPAVQPPADGPEATGSRRMSRAKVLVFGLALAVVAATVAWVVRGPAEAPGGVPAAPSPGERTLRAAHSGLCLGERPETRTGKVYQRPCEDRLPQYSLVRMGERDWRVASWHPEFEDGCMGVHWAWKKKGAWLEDDSCQNRDPGAETFRFEPVGTPVEGYRMRVMHTEMCITVPGASRAEWTALQQQPCTEDAAGQLFRFDAV
ncbi:helix-turn-helix domain-containing protein [Streptomyces sp. NPDC087440]|uniref:helix-turn-helix domain-containing protein n=1 Tax=Streptomyces sp. NPDC087440 TaxID=3365790 RepID=UPI00382FB796